MDRQREMQSMQNEEHHMQREPLSGADRYMERDIEQNAQILQGDK